MRYFHFGYKNQKEYSNSMLYYPPSVHVCYNSYTVEQRNKLFLMFKMLCLSTRYSRNFPFEVQHMQLKLLNYGYKLLHHFLSTFKIGYMCKRHLHFYYITHWSTFCSFDLRSSFQIYIHLADTLRSLKAYAGNQAFACFCLFNITFFLDGLVMYIKYI